MALEQELKRVLESERPPAGFAARVMARVDRSDTGGVSARIRGPWRSAVAATLLLTIGAGSWLAHHEVERRRGEHARAQVLLALHITAQKIHVAREQVRDLGAHASTNESHGSSRRLGSR